MKILIKGGTVICPYNNIEQKLDVLVQDGVIARVEQEINEGADRVIDAEGKYVFPSFTDIHVHLREPGQEYKEDIASGCAAAAAGGFGDVCCMPNTKPTADSEAVISYILKKAEQAPCDVHPIAAITKGLAGEELTEMGELKRAGAIAFSDDGRPVESSRMMRLAMQYAKAFDALIISHCEDRLLADGGVMNEGVRSAVIGLKGVPWTAEALMVQREIMLAELLDTFVHIAHVSCAQSVECIRQAKKRGVRVTAETCPHYIFANDSIVENYDAMSKVNPPLRSEQDRLAVIQGLLDGSIDCIASDHAPHHIDEKLVEYNTALSGISGIETSFALSYTALVKTGLMPLSELVRLYTSAPDSVVRLQGKGIREGAPAKLTVADCGRESVIDAASFVSKGKNTPFDGVKVYAGIVCTVYNGQIVYEA